MKQGRDQAKKDIEAGSNIMACLDLQYNLQRVLHSYVVSNKYSIAIQDKLAEVSGKKWSDAARSLYYLLEDIIEGRIREPRSRGKKGFFAKLFGG